MSACQICNLSTSSAKNFLLRCAVCTFRFHHRCHNPPITDRELVARANATKSGDPKNGLGAWRCNFCRSAGATEPTELRMSTPNDAIRGPKEPDVIEISDSESSPPPASTEVVSLVSSDDEEMVRHPVVHSRSIPDVAAAQKRGQPAPPRAYETPPWLKEAQLSAPLDTKMPQILSSKTSSTSSTLHRSRKPKATHKLNSDGFYFSVTSWMEKRKT